MKRRATREVTKKNRYLAVLVVLRAVAGAAELVRRLVPGHNAAQVRAHSVDAEGLKGAVLLGHQVSGITLPNTTGGHANFSFSPKFSYKPLDFAFAIKVFFIF